MDWVENYQLFLFDFDGLLVNTEKLHYQAYIQLCKQRGFHLKWSFDEYIKIAHYSSHGLEEQIYKTFPALHEQEPNWKVLYREKTEAYLDLIRQGKADLMPGAKELLLHLEKKKIKRCVVTHSLAELIHATREKNKVLDSIPNWITREDYKEAKPSPDSYLVAIERFAEIDDKIIGFEDTPRGLSALMGTRATPVLITSENYKEIPGLVEKGVVHLKSLLDLPGPLCNN